MNIFEVSDAFLRHLAILGRSERTQKDYRQIVERFVEFQLRRRRLIEETTSEDLGEYVLQMRANQLAPTAMRLYTTVLRVFFTWATDEGIVARDPSRKLRTGYGRPRMLKVPSMRIYATLLASIPNETTIDRRDQLIVRMLFNTGLRISELCSLRSDAIDLESGDFLVLGKGASLRQGLVSGRALDDLREWIRNGRPSVGRIYSRALFVTPTGSALDAAGIQTMMRQRNLGAGILARYEYPSGASRGVLTPHALRHLHASKLLELGVALPVIQASLGHANISSTMVYLRPSQRSLRDAHEQLDASVVD